LIYGVFSNNGAAAMKNAMLIARNSLIVALIALASGCVIAPREGYYDGNHHRYYHEGGWHDCGDHDDHCR
jgi:hypothetical protein